MFGMNGFHVSASGAIQGHHGPLVLHLTTHPLEIFFISKIVDYPLFIRAILWEGGLTLYSIDTYLDTYFGVHCREVEHRPCNHEVPSSSPGSGSQLWDFSLAHTFGASTGVVPRKQNRER